MCLREFGKCENTKNLWEERQASLPCFVAWLAPLEKHDGLIWQLRFVVVVPLLLIITQNVSIKVRNSPPRSKNISLSWTRSSSVVLCCVFSLRTHFCSDAVRERLLLSSTYDRHPLISTLNLIERCDCSLSSSRGDITNQAFIFTGLVTVS